MKDSKRAEAGACHHGLVILMMLLLLLCLGACDKHDDNGVEHPTVEQTGPVQDYKNIFKIKLYTDKLSYETSEKISIRATLEYIGDEDQITVWHGNPYIAFLISNGKEFNTGGLKDATLTSTVIEKNKVYRFEYEKNGGYDSRDSSAGFWRQFYSEKDLYLPEGQYSVTVRGDFSIDQETVGQKNNLTDQVTIIVKK